MLNETDYFLILRYNWISQQITKYLGTSLYILCFIGTVMNMFIFIRRTYHSRSCSLYLTIASIFDFLHLNFGPVSNILQYGFHYHWAIHSNSFCKTKTYIVFLLSINSATLTTMATIDRYILSSKNTRRWRYCTRPIAIRFIQCSILFWLIVSIPIVFCYTCIRHASENEHLICSNLSETFTCFLVQILHVCFFNGLGPPLIMMFFGFLTLTNIQHLRRRSMVKSVRLEQINYQLTSMLILQSIKSSFASLPFSIYNCYLLITRTMDKSSVYQAKENLIHQIAYLLFWSNYTSFFVYMCSSDIFRTQSIRAIRKTFCYSLRKRQRQFSDQSELRRLTIALDVP